MALATAAEVYYEACHTEDGLTTTEAAWIAAGFIPVGKAVGLAARVARATGAGGVARGLEMAIRTVDGASAVVGAATMRIAGRALSGTSRLPIPARFKSRLGQSGEILSAVAIVTRANIGGGTGTTRAARALARRLGGGAGDDAGHAVGRLLGGLGGSRSGNIFPQNIAMNRGALRNIEQQVAAHVRNGHTAIIREVPRYRAGSTRPYEISYQFRLDGRTRRIDIDNP